MNTVRVRDVEEAVQLAESWKQSGYHDWFRGQTRNWPVRSSFMRLEGEAAQETALDKLGRFESWVKSTPGLDHLAPDTDATLAVAQHYGLPTNFVDFTTEPSIFSPAKLRHFKCWCPAVAPSSIHRPA